MLCKGWQLERQMAAGKTAIFSIIEKENLTDMRIAFFPFGLLGMLLVIGMIWACISFSKVKYNTVATSKVMLLLVLNPDSTCCEVAVTPTCIIATQVVQGADTFYLDGRSQRIPNNYIILSAKKIQ